MYSRDIHKLEKWIGAWISAEKESFSKNPTILWPTDFWPVFRRANEPRVQGFTENLEKTLGVIKRKISIRNLWKENTPSEADSSDINEYLKNVSNAFPIDISSC